MPNKTSALEWLIIAYHDLKSAQLLYKVEHYTDSIGEDRYPNPNYSLPSRDEVQEVLEFTEKLFKHVCYLLEIKKEDIR